MKKGQVRDWTKGPIGPPWWREMTANYLAFLRRKGRRPKTLTSYLVELRACGRWLEAQAIPDAESLTGSILERWQDYRAGVIAVGTQGIAAAAVRGILRWAATQEPPLCSATLWLRIITPRIAILLPKPIPQRDLDRILDALTPVPAASDVRRLRTRALFLVILTSGARITEALSLDRDQFRDRMATVTQKGGGEKLLVISRGAEIAVNDYLTARHDSCPALFVSHSEGPPAMRGRRWDPAGAPRRALRPARLQHHGAQENWDALCSELSVARFTSHRIRHSCATELLRAHVDSLVIAKHLGHRGLGSIAGYAEVGLDTRHEMLAVMDGRRRRAS